MKAGGIDLKSVRPLNEIDVDNVSDADNEETMEVEEAGEECERLALEKEGDVIKRLIDPLLPSKKDVEEHWIRGHVPYRNWCDVCVRARGREMEHAKDKGGERKLPEYHFDYCFPGDEMGYKWTVLVGKEK